MCTEDAGVAQGESIMSATGRNLEGKERHALDFYETPGWCTRALLSHLGTPIGFDSDTAKTIRAAPTTILDAGAGTGAIVRECLLWWPSSYATGIELDADRAFEAQRLLLQNPDWTLERCRVHQGSFYDLKDQWDLVISNPPYAKAEEFVRHALTIGRTCAFLLRLNWLASKSRAQFHRDHPSDVFVLPKRPSFTGDGKTDATEYAWFVWGPTDVEECLNGGFRGNRWRILDVKP